ncbi:hypothetical protein EV363DRAFT_1305049 [Boletus edulis]|nr:hypothetical protein EV363DRAFT_1305049 [Boletus edulis]
MTQMIKVLPLASSWRYADLFTDRAFHKLVELQLHIPNEIPRDVQTNAFAELKQVQWSRKLAGIMLTASFIHLVTTEDAANKPNARLLSIDEISGILHHSETCLDTHQMSRNPHIPLEPRLREYALHLLRNQIPLTQLQYLCQQWALQHLGDAAGNNHYRYMLSDHESMSLYRTIARENGIGQCTTAEDNLNRWFHMENPGPQPPFPILSESCLFYQPHIPSETEQFALILSTPKQRELAWQFGHKHQMIMDGTFGICNACILLFILMVVDDKNKGVPVAQLILFTARKDARAVHADYNGKILEDLL